MYCKQIMHCTCSVVFQNAVLLLTVQKSHLIAVIELSLSDYISQLAVLGANHISNEANILQVVSLCSAYYLLVS